MLARIVNKLVKPFGLECRASPSIKPAPELPAEYLQDTKVLNNRYMLLDKLPQGGIVTEVGVGFGNFTSNILQRMQPKHFVAIDTFTLDEKSWFGQKAHKDTFGQLSHQEFYEKRFQSDIDSGKNLAKKRAGEY